IIAGFSRNDAVCFTKISDCDAALMGSLTRTVSPSVVSLTATPSVGKITVTWPQVINTFGQVVQTLTRTPAFSSPVTPTGSVYIDTAVTSGTSYTYSLVVTDARGL